MTVKSIRGAVLALVLAGVLIGVGAGLSQTVSINATSDPQVQQLRLASLGYMEKGQWAAAEATTTELLTKDPKDALGLELRRLTAEQDRIAHIRKEQRAEAFHDVTTRIDDSVTRGAWVEALGEATRAGDLAASKADLGKEPWFDKVIDHATTQADAHRKKGEWLKAAATYLQMATLFENEKNQYHDLAKKTNRYARLEATYKDAKGVDKAVDGIDEGMMAKALEYIRRSYVDEPDFKKMTVNSVECLIALTEVPTLVKAMPSLAPGEAVDKMRKDLTALREQVAASEKVGLPELSAAYIKAKRINLETVKLPEGVIIREFLDGATEMCDPFTSMIWPSEKSEFDKSMHGEFSGVGIQISLESGQLTVVSPLEDSPAYRAGIQAGDVVTAINGEDTQGITIDQAVNRITGPTDTAVVLTIRRRGTKDTREIHLTREKIVIKSVHGFMREANGQWDYMADKDYKIGYVRITNFMPHTVDELEKAMDAMAVKGARGLILDFRFNPGGLLTQAEQMSNLFIADGVIVSTKGRASPLVERKAQAGGNSDLPLVVLVNEFSASASEIVTGALKDHDRAIVVGERTFGKGCVQNVIPVDRENGALGEQKEPAAYMKLTTAYYYLPSGRSLHRHEDSITWGVEPVVPVKVTHDELADILDLRRDSDVLHQPGEEPSTQPDRRAGRADHVKVDAQLEAGLLVLRAELLKKKL